MKKKRHWNLRVGEAAALILFLAAMRAGAADVVVQNDSVTDFSFATIVGGFDPLEEGGAWLTSPCNGRIIEVRILWLAADPGALPHLGDNIWIRRSGAFPSPGLVLAQMEGPVLMPGGLNQFRFLDENQTIPLSVPVTTGQTVSVTLEFGEATFPISGSVVRDNNGCQAGKNVLFAIPGGWINFCFFLAGDLVVRMVVNCDEPHGACCYPNGNCTEDLEQSVCQGTGGTFQGNGSDCNAISCPQPPRACCFMPQGCINLTPDDCQLAGGFTQAPGTNCATIECFPIGACCLPVGSCLDNVSPEQCTAQGGAFIGDGTDCQTTMCTQPTGGCCLSNGNCLVLLQASCAIIPNSTWAGPFTNCQDGNNNGMPDACESPCGTPSQDLDHDCDVDLLDYDQYFDCRTGPGIIAQQPCLCFDFDDDGDVDLRDLGAFMRVFTGQGGGCP